METRPCVTLYLADSHCWLCWCDLNRPACVCSTFTLPACGRKSLHVRFPDLMLQHCCDNAMLIMLQYSVTVQHSVSHHNRRMHGAGVCMRARERSVAGAVWIGLSNAFSIIQPGPERHGSAESRRPPPKKGFPLKCSPPPPPPSYS